MAVSAPAAAYAGLRKAYSRKKGSRYPQYRFEKKNPAVKTTKIHRREGLTFLRGFLIAMYFAQDQFPILEDEIPAIFVQDKETVLS